MSQPSGKGRRDATAAALTVASGEEMLRAASDVIVARLTMLAEGLADPGKANLVEMSLMGTEKIEALQNSAAAMAGEMGELTARAAHAAWEELGRARHAAEAMASAATPQAYAQAGFDYAAGWWSRAADQMTTLSAELLRTQSETLRPIHDAAIANARRLAER